MKRKKRIHLKFNKLPNYLKIKAIYKGLTKTQRLFVNFFIPAILALASYNYYQVFTYESKTSKEEIKEFLKQNKEETFKDFKNNELYTIWSDSTKQKEYMESLYLSDTNVAYMDSICDCY